MRGLVMQTSEPASTRKSTELMIKILNCTYLKAGLNQVANNATQMNAEEITLLLSILEDFKEFFGGTLGDYATDLVNLEKKTGSKLFNSRYYLVPVVKKETFCKELDNTSKIVRHH